MSEDRRMANDLIHRAFKAKMPLSLRLKVFLKMGIWGANKEKRLEMIRELGQRRRFSVPREDIDWYPSINQDRCQSCKICLEFCPKGVFTEGAEKGEVRVANPRQCVVLCAGCQNKCPYGAISFPDKGNFEKYIYYV